MYKRQSGEERKKIENVITLGFVSCQPLAWSHDEEKWD